MCIYNIAIYIILSILYIYLLKCYMGLSSGVHAHDELLSSRFTLAKETLNTDVPAAYSCIFSIKADMSMNHLHA